MSRRYQAGFVRPGYDPLKVPNAPTIGTATAGSSLCASVAFTAPSCVGGSAITSYTAISNCGAKFASGASSPVVVKCLTAGTAYTFKVFASNSYGPSFSSASSNSVTPAAVGQQAYTSAGTYSWVAPAGVTSVSVVAVGGGSGAGGGLGWKNNIAVTPGNSYSVVVGAGGRYISSCAKYNGGDSYFINGCTVKGGGAKWRTAGGYTGTGGGNGGIVCSGSSGGAGAGGYSGNGGRSGSSPTAGSGGGGGGAAGSCNGGGGVGILGQGANGAAGVVGACRWGRGGSGGGNGGDTYVVNICCNFYTAGGSGGNYGGGAGESTSGYGSFAGGGAVRIIWPGTTRQFPSTCTGNK